MFFIEMGIVFSNLSFFLLVLFDLKFFLFFKVESPFRVRSREQYFVNEIRLRSINSYAIASSSSRHNHTLVSSFTVRLIWLGFGGFAPILLSLLSTFSR